MFGVYRRELLARLLLRPDSKYHVRELARLTGFSTGSIHRELKTMAESGLLLREHLGNQVLYQANRDCSIYEDLASIFRKTIGLTDVLRDALGVIVDEIQLAFVFGSMAKGTQSAFSDIDILVLGNAPLVEVVKALAPTPVELSREINPVTMTVEKFVSLVDKQDRFATRLLEEPKLYLIGDDHEFGKLVAHRTTR